MVWKRNIKRCVLIVLHTAIFEKIFIRFHVGTHGFPRPRPQAIPPSTKSTSACSVSAKVLHAMRNDGPQRRGSAARRFGILCCTPAALTHTVRAAAAQRKQPVQCTKSTLACLASAKALHDMCDDESQREGSAARQLSCLCAFGSTGRMWQWRDKAIQAASNGKARRAADNQVDVN